MWKKVWNRQLFWEQSQNWVFRPVNREPFCIRAYVQRCVRYVRFKPWPRQSAACIWILKLGVSAANLYSTSNFPQWFGAAFLNVFFFFLQFCTLLNFLRIVLFTKRMECHERNCHLRKKKKITVTNKEQEPIFSDGFKPPATSVSENLLKFSNSSFSDSDSETARTWT